MRREAPTAETEAAEVRWTATTRAVALLVEAREMEDEGCVKVAEELGCKKNSVGQCRGFLTVDLLGQCRECRECRSVGVSGCRAVSGSVRVSECRDPSSVGH